MAPLIRRATPPDESGILQCLQDAFAKYRQAYTPAAFEDTVLSPELLRKRLTSMAVFVATCDDEVVGTIACSPVGGGEGHLRGMAVKPGWHGRGIAQMLLQAAEEFLQLQGCRRITLDTTEPLKRATRFYCKHGYRPSGRVQDFFGMQLFEYVKTTSADLQEPHRQC